MKIRFFANFADSKKLKTLLENINECSNTNITYGNDYTHVVIFNTVMPDISHIPKRNVLGFAQEPYPFLNLTPFFIEYAEKYIGKYFIGDKINLPDTFIESNAYLFFTLPRSLSDKTKRMSMMVSQRKYAPGHKYRHDLVNEILLRNLPIDIYGRGCRFYKGTNSRLKGEFDSRLKGEFDNPLVIFEKYEFTISVENFISKHYFSEKVIEPLLCNTTPIYLGCSNIDVYFPNQTIRLYGELQNDIRLITDILQNPEKYRKTIDIPLVKSKVNLLNNLNNLYLE